MIAITISGVDRAPEWDTLQALLRQAVADDTATLTRIARSDNSCDYRAKGNYELTLVCNITDKPSNGTKVPVFLKVE